MSSAIRKARAVGGVLTIAALLFMLVMEFLYPGLHLSARTFVLLVSMVSALLGIDVALSRKEAIINAAIKIVRERYSDE